MTELASLAENVRAYLERVNLAVLATSNADGTPQQTALWYLLRDDTIILNTATTSKKVRNLRRRPWGSVLVVESNPSRHVCVAGPVELDDSPSVVEADLTALASRYLGAEAGPGVAANIAKVPHITIRVKVEKVQTFGKI